MNKQKSIMNGGWTQTDTQRIMTVLIVEICRLVSPELSYVISRLETAGLSPREIEYHMNGLLLALRRADEARTKRDAERATAPSAADLDAVAQEQKVQEETDVSAD